MASYRGALPQLQAISPYMPARMGDARVSAPAGALPADTSGQDALNKGAGVLGKALGKKAATTPPPPAGVNFGGPTTFSGNIGAAGQGSGMLGASGDTLAFAPGGTEFSTSLGTFGQAGASPNLAAAGPAQGGMGAMGTGGLAALGALGYGAAIEQSGKWAGDAGRWLTVGNPIYGPQLSGAYAGLKHLFGGK